MVENELLVSVIVLSYNSEKTIVDTLDSIYNQTYEKIELIVTDDCSKDNTKEIVLKWIANHSSRFVAVKTNFKKSNSGVSINGDEGINLSVGKWIKCIAADDKLLEKCIESNIKYVKEHKCHIVFSNMHYLQNGKTIIEMEEDLKEKLNTFSFMNVNQQYNKLLQENPLPAPTAFFSRELYEMVGGFDKEICMIEDWPFWIKVVKAGIHIFYNNDFTVIYRMSDNSISRDSNFWKEAKKVKEKYCYPNISKKHILYFYHERWRDMKYLCRAKVKDYRMICILIELIFGILWPPGLAQYIKSVFRCYRNKKGV